MLLAKNDKYSDVAFNVATGSSWGSVPVLLQGLWRLSHWLPSLSPSLCAHNSYPSCSWLLAGSDLGSEQLWWGFWIENHVSWASHGPARVGNPPPPLSFL